MYITNRLSVIGVLLVALVPLVTLAELTTDDRNRAEEELETVLDSAKDSYRQGQNLNALRNSSELIVDQSKVRLLALGKTKMKMREEISELRSRIQLAHNETGKLIQEQTRASELFAREQDRFVRFVQLMQTRQLVAVADTEVGDGLVRRLLRGSLGERVDKDMRAMALVRARERLVLSLMQAGDNARMTKERLEAVAGEQAIELVEKEKAYEEVQKEYREVQDTLDRAEERVTLSEAQLKQVKDIVADVHEQVLKMQGELARIDARLKSRAERALIDKGLLEARPGEHSKGEIAGSADFMWPAYGPVSAGFHDARYRRFFGVPHKAVDIVIPQSSAVFSAADGVVFLVRQGGATGYTYVLVGHADGYATLYGHLSSVAVTAGQEVRRGQGIGLSGGAPGTDGAGPMTTGAHLHFEMILNGVHIDPLTVLP